MAFFELNWIPILVSAIVSMVIGFIWYSPKVFGNQWMRLMKFKKADMKKMKVKPAFAYLGMFVITLVANFVLSLLIKISVPESVIGGALIGFLVWLGFIATTTFSGVLWANKRRELYMIENGHYMLSFVIAGIILTAW